MGTLFTSFKDLTLKALPISKRGATWIDWNNTATSPIRFANDLFYQRALNLDQLTGTSIQMKSIPVLLNDLYDPLHRNITLTNYNSVSNQLHYRVNVPTYLAFGDYEEIIQDTLNKFVYVGVLGEFNTYATGVSHEAEDYLTELESNLVGDEILTNHEIWAVQYVYNQLKGASLLSDFATLHLYSQSSKLNAEVDFMNPSSAGLIEIAASDGQDWNALGTKSGGTSYYRTGNLLNALITDPLNQAFVCYISEDGGVDDKYDFGVYNPVGNQWNAFSSTTISSGIKMLYNIGGAPQNNLQPNEGDLKGMYLGYVDAGYSNLMKDNVTANSDVLVSPVPVMAAMEDYINARNNNGSAANHSANRIGTWGRINAGLNKSNRKFVSNVLTEYNNRLNR